MSRFRADHLTTFACDVLSEAGLPRDRAQLVAETLVASDLMGHTTHGLQLLLPYAQQIKDGLMTSEGEPEVIQDRGSAMTLNGNFLPGPYLVYEAIRLAKVRLANHPIVTIAIGNSHHIACLAAYLESVTKDGLMIILLSSDPTNQTVAPFGGLTGTFSPDPLAFGIPTQDKPILFDSSASAVANGVVMQKYAQNEKLGGPWLMDSKGQVTNDPEQFFKDPPATILPVGGLDLGFKGFGYALLIEALTSGLAGKGRKEGLNRWSASVLVQLIDPGQFGGRTPFLEEMQFLVDRCHASQPRPGFEQVRLPGERALALKEKQLREGVELHPEVIETLQKCHDQFKVEKVQAI